VLVWARQAAVHCSAQWRVLLHLLAAQHMLPCKSVNWGINTQKGCRTAVTDFWMQGTAHVSCIGDCWLKAGQLLVGHWCASGMLLVCAGCQTVLTAYLSSFHALPAAGGAVLLVLQCRVVETPILDLALSSPLRCLSRL
jgi:hypothetical protein